MHLQLQQSSAGSPATSPSASTCSTTTSTTTCSPSDPSSSSPPSSYPAVLSLRRQLYGPNTSLMFDQPLMLVKGRGTYMYDSEGVPYLDCINNVAHLGHGNEEVAAAVCSQLRTLNTNSRYLHPDLVAYSRLLLNTLNSPGLQQHRTPPAPHPPPASNAPHTSSNPISTISTTTATNSARRPETSSQSAGAPTAAAAPAALESPQGAERSAAGVAKSAAHSTPTGASSSGSSGKPLEVVYLVCSGSEANDLALRMITANRPTASHVAVMAGAYHGHTTALMPLSSYKFWGRGGEGRQPHVHVVPCPDVYRGEHLDGRAAARAVLAEAARAGAAVGAFFAESVLSCGGQVVYPPGYLQDLYSEFRAAGVLCVADEVQCGFGRCGATFWAFQTQCVQPDIVTMGKPIGNGYPLAALATTRAVAQGFAATGVEYFNTYGGSTAAVAAGLAVLRILLRDNLQQHAQQVGAYLLCGLRRLVSLYGVAGHARGLGLMGGLEVVTDKESRRQAPVIAHWIRERMRARRVLLSTDGPYDNVLKYKPPMVFGFREADIVLDQLECVLRDELTPGQYRALVAQEEEHWARVVGPRMKHYTDNAARLYGLLADQGARPCVPAAVSRL